MIGNQTHFMKTNIKRIMTIGEKIRDFGVGKFGSVKAFAEALDWHPSSLYDYFNNISMPGAPLLIKLFEMGCDLNWLLAPNDSLKKEPIKNNLAEDEIKKLKKEIADLKGQLSEINKILSKGKKL